MTKNTSTLPNPWWARLLTRGRCVILGHDDLPTFGENRFFLTCHSCGRETPGFELRPLHGLSGLSDTASVSRFRPRAWHQALVLAGLIWTGPKPTPAEAARTLAPHQYRLPVEYDGPTVVFGASSAYVASFPTRWSLPAHHSCCDAYVNGQPWFGPLPVFLPHRR